MEEREITDRIGKLFEETAPILKDIYKGFTGDKINLLKESRLRLRESSKKRLPGTQKLIREEGRNEAVRRFVIALPHLQRVALALDNLVDKMETKVESDIPFSEKALDELKQIMAVVGAEFTDVRYYCMSKDHKIREQIQAEAAEVMNMTNEFDRVHQNRLISGVCTPKASYLYVDMTDSLKRIATELAAFADKV
jgi:phosphate:Na+ symporter